MSPILSILISLALSQVTPDRILIVVRELITFVDPLIAKRGFVLRQLWAVLRSQLTSDAVVKDIADLLAEVKAQHAVAGAPQWTAPNT